MSRRTWYAAHNPWGFARAEAGGGDEYETRTFADARAVLTPDGAAAA